MPAGRVRVPPGGREAARDIYCAGDRLQLRSTHFSHRLYYSHSPGVVSWDDRPAVQVRIRINFLLPLTTWGADTRPRENHAAAMLRKCVGEKTPEFVVMLEMAIAMLSIPCAVIILSTVLHRGTTTPFEPSDHRSHWVAGPNSRGTINLIWLCASTIYTCVHVSVHIDVLSINQNHEDFTKNLENQNLSRWMKTCIVAVMNAAKSRWARHAVWICFNIFAPEVVVLVAVLEYLSACDGKRFMVACGQTDWDMTLAFYADMGGFARWQSAADAGVVDDFGDTDTISVIGFDSGIDYTRHFRSGREFMKWYRNEAQEGRRFSAKQLTLIRDEIKDRSDESLLLKLLTATQASWLFVETMIRLAEPKHAVSQIEITTCAYIFCTLITYLCWLKKPYHISGHIILPRQLDSDPSKPSNSFILSNPSNVLDRSDSQGDTSQPPLPTMLWDHARFTPFNRSFDRPNRSWIRK